MLPETKAEKKIFCPSVADLDSAAKQITEFAGIYRVWLFRGELGAGKTTLIKTICKHFQVTDNVSSPSYSIINVYENAQNETFYHFDFYRVKNLPEAIDLGCEEYFYSGDFCFIEWPDLVENLLPDETMVISLQRDATGGLEIHLHKNG